MITFLASFLCFLCFAALAFSILCRSRTGVRLDFGSANSQRPHIMLTFVDVLPGLETIVSTNGFERWRMRMFVWILQCQDFSEIRYLGFGRLAEKRLATGATQYVHQLSEPHTIAMFIWVGSGTVPENLPVLHILVQHILELAAA